MALSVRHDASMSGMDMGSMGTSPGVPGYFYMQKMFWVVIGAVIGIAALCNVLNIVLLWQRSRSPTAKPRSFFWITYATATALTREVANSSLGSYHIRSATIRSPPLGKVIAVVSYVITVLVFSLYKYDTFDQWSWEDIAYRAGCVAQAQVPLVFLLAGKQNIIGFLTGSSYERLNWLHRWVARTLWMTVTMHMGFFFRSWARYDYIKVKLATDSMTQTGFAAWCILTTIVLTSLLPIRRWNYELFVIQHLVLFAGLMGAVMIHVDYGKLYIWISIAFYFFDRVIRFLVTMMANLSIFHRRSSGLWANKATLTPLPGNATRISIDRPVLSWKPGQHMFLSCHSVVPLQSHPFTATSLPSDGKLEFIVKAHKGGTRRFHTHASKYRRLPDEEICGPLQKRYVGIEGPYGNIRPLQQFDSIILFAGSTGATFTMPLMRDLVRRWKQGLSGQRHIVARKIRFIWVIKARDQLSWFQDQLEQAKADVGAIRNEHRNTDFELDISIYITCDEELNATDSELACTPPTRRKVEFYTLTESSENQKKVALDHDIEVKSLISEAPSAGGCGPDGSCCCKTTVEDEKAAPARCCCKQVDSSSSSSADEKSGSSSTADAQTRKDDFKVLSGRPKPRIIIQKVLEEAEGESAVVVCGPQGLQDDVRHSVVALSDERAVHKGTGAQGIYLHVEGFCY